MEKLENYERYTYFHRLADTQTCVMSPRTINGICCTAHVRHIHVRMPYKPRMKSRACAIVVGGFSMENNYDVNCLLSV